MAKIELLFGWPTSQEEEISVENCAYNWDVSIETAVIKQFRFWINHLTKKSNDDGDNFFELLLFIECNELFYLPKISAGIYRHNGFVLPKMIINGDYGVDKTSGSMVLLSENHINAIGSRFEDEIGYEYFEYARIGLIKATKEDAIYLLGDRPHIYESGKFYKAKVG
jgi:hypothetical protein